MEKYSDMVTKPDRSNVSGPKDAKYRATKDGDMNDVNSRTNWHMDNV